MQQSIRLLQLSTLELQTELEQALRDNPLLENDEESPPNEPDEDTPNDPRNEPTKGIDDSSVEINRDETYGENWVDDWRHHDSASEGSDEEKPGLQLAAIDNSLQQHLIEQLNLTQASELDRNLVLWLIDYVNEDGYLTASLEELWQTLNQTPDLEFEELNSALTLLQSFDPPGVGARNAGECLALQLKYAQAQAKNPII